MKPTVWVITRRYWTSRTELLEVVTTGNTLDDCKRMADRLNANRELDASGEPSDIYEATTHELYEWQCGSRTRPPILLGVELKQLWNTLQNDPRYKTQSRLVSTLDRWERHHTATDPMPDLSIDELYTLTSVLMSSPRYAELQGLAMKLETITSVRFFNRP